jgi:hypothetical protein
LGAKIPQKCKNHGFGLYFAGQMRYNRKDLSQKEQRKGEKQT